MNLVALGRDGVKFTNPSSPDPARSESPAGHGHVQYPLAGELDPLRALAESSHLDPVFTMYLTRLNADGSAVERLGFFRPRGEDGRVYGGYRLVPDARGAGLASEAVEVALLHAASHDARTAAADRGDV